MLPGLTASGSADLNKEISVDITVEDMVGEVIDDTLADRIVDWFRANIVPKPGSRYFLVRETVKAGSVSYRLKETDLAKLGGKAELEKLANGAANVTFHDDDGTFEIKQKFSPARMAVCTSRPRSSSTRRRRARPGPSACRSSRPMSPRAPHQARRRR